MRRLHTRVNLIPVIAKADTLTDDEVVQFKARILSDLAHHRIEIYQAPQYELEDEETLAENEEIVVSHRRRWFPRWTKTHRKLTRTQRKIPFAVVGSDTVVSTPDGRQARGRAYPWGTIEVDNEDHCDFVKLRQMLIRTHMEELKEHTNGALYENYRTEKLLAMGVAQDHSVFKEVKCVVIALYSPPEPH
jgi:septin 7